MDLFIIYSIDRDKKKLGGQFFGGDKIFGIGDKPEKNRTKKNVWQKIASKVKLIWEQLLELEDKGLRAFKEK